MDCYNHKNAFQKLHAAWEDLLQRNQGASIFQTIEWNRTWWDFFGSGKELLLLTATGEEGSLIGIAPLYGKLEDEGERVLRLVGGIDLSDYLDLISLPGREEPLCRALIDYLLKDYREWDLLDLHNIPSGSSTLAFLGKAAREAGLRVTVEEEEVCPYILLPPTWEEYLATLTKKDRHELRRKMRKAGSAGGERRHVVSDYSHLSGEIEEFCLLHGKSRKEKSDFMVDGRKSFFLEFSRQFHRKGWLDLSFLMIKGQKAASLLSFRYRGRIYLYNSGFDPAFTTYSAGIALMGQSIKAAIEDGYEMYDFLRGSEGYKYRLGARDLTLYRMNISM